MSGGSDIHILNPMRDAFGGSERRAMALAKLLAGSARVKIWSTHLPDPRIHADVPVVPVDVSKLRFPRGGTLVVMGCYFEIPTWVSVMRPCRVIVVYNIPHIEQLHQTAYVLGAYGLNPIDIVTAGPDLEQHVASLGLDWAGFEPSWIDLKRFKPGAASNTRPFTVGRMSRDVPEKFHPEDLGLFRALAEKGVRVRIQGGTCLATTAEANGHLEIEPTGAMSAEAFLGSLDAFVYRTSPNWTEAWGRVVTEAMAAGLPAVVDRRIGAARILDSGRDGFVFESTDEAMAQLEVLRDDEALRQRVGHAARATVERLFGKEARQRWIDFYIGGVVPKTTVPSGAPSH